MNKDKKVKKTYQKPQLKKLGSLKSLTKFGGSAAADFFGNLT